ncbi:hypothetical protein EJB05_27691, partial [Eragrostis curvula]
MQSTPRKGSSLNVGIDNLRMKKRVNAKLRMVQVQEVEQARVKEKKEMQNKQAKTDAKLHLLLSQLRASQAD